MFKLTAEQQQVVETGVAHFQEKSGPLGCIGRAGAAKTTTSVEVVKAYLAQSFGTQATYCAFGRHIVEDAKRKFPQGTEIRTMHSIAYRAYAQRMRDQGEILRYYTKTQIFKFMRPGEWAAHLDLTPYKTGELLRRTLIQFCASSDFVLQWFHVPYDAVRLRLKSKWPVVTEEDIRSVRFMVAEDACTLWAMIVNGTLPLNHDAYLKLFQLENKQVETDAIIVDEVQDFSPVQQAILHQQQCPSLTIGDADQMIYAWRGANTGLLDHSRLTLSTSFRFGDQIADRANAALLVLGSTPPIIAGGPKTELFDYDQPYTLLCRTNATVFISALELIAAGERISMVGSLKSAIKVISNVYSLYTGETHGLTPPLSDYENFQQLVEDCEEDPELKRCVKLVQEYEDRTPELIQTLQSNIVSEDRADVTICTAHASKGREWPQVKLADDFILKDDKGKWLPEELRLFYVACTRPRNAILVSDELDELFKIRSMDSELAYLLS